jgi:putative FmdB family regulatory protein
MPTYEYKCPAGHSFEKFYPTMNNQRRAKCPTCGKSAERQISGGAGLVFKGSGFYITDYKRAGSPTPESTGEAKSESKPEAKPATESKPDGGKKKKKLSSDK